MSFKWSLPLGSLAGIPVFLHWTFVFILAYVSIYVAFIGGGLIDIIYHIIFVLALFACVVLHELGHALAARNYNITTRDIVLLPIGGMARLEKMPEDPVQELVVAVAGPLVNVVIALILAPLVIIMGVPEFEGEGPVFLRPDNFLFALTAVNIFLVLFNMIPAFPMDGGRVFRAILGFWYGHAEATRKAATVGQSFAILFFIAAFFVNPLLILIAFFVFFGSHAESSYIQTKYALSGYKIRDVMMSNFTLLRKDDQVYRAVELLLKGSEQEFVVIDEEGKMTGVLTRNDIIQGLSEVGRRASLEHLIHKDITSFSPETPIENAYHHMSQTGLSISPVINRDGEVIGVVDRDNIFEFIWIQDALEAREKVKARLEEESGKPAS